MKLLDLFSGIGGFHKGFEQAGFTFDWVGFSEIDKYASAVYRHQYKNAEELGDIKLIQPGRDLPDHIDILCGGFPCQAFSVAGKRKGFDDTRGTLFFEIARLLRHYRETESPIDYFVLENVKGLLSHDNGRTFATIYRVLSNLGYTVEFELLNTRNYSRPQNRERIFLVGYTGGGSGSKIFPIGEDGELYKKRNARTKSNFVKVEGLKQIGTIGKDSEATRVYDANGISRTIKDGGGMGAKTGLYQVDTLERQQDQHGVMVKSVRSAGNKDGSRYYYEDDVTQTIAANPTSDNLPMVNGSSIRRLTPVERQQDQHGVMVKQYGQKSLNETLEKENLKEDDVKALDLYNKKAQDISPTLTEPHHNSLRLYERSQIRRLTPKETCRLQGFPDDWNEYGEFDGKVKPMSDTQRYKQCGNAVTVNVVQAVAERIGEMK